MVVLFCVDFLRFLLGLADVTILKVTEVLIIVDTLVILLSNSNMVGQKRVKSWKNLCSILCNSLQDFQLAIWGQNHRLVQVEESEDEVCRALSCERKR